MRPQQAHSAGSQSHSPGHSHSHSHHSSSGVIELVHPLARELTGPRLSDKLHHHGINLRYLGKVDH